MFKLFKYLFLIAFVFGGWVLAATSLHVVRSDPKTKYCPVQIQFVTKSSLGFRDTWVDTTRWTAPDLASHPQIVQRLEQAGLKGILDEVTSRPLAPVEIPKPVVKAAPESTPPVANSTAPKEKSIFDFGNSK